MERSAKVAEDISVTTRARPRPFDSTLRIRSSSSSRCLKKRREWSMKESELLMTRTCSVR
uniref:Uncharacterized protein n=1 Tax=Hyaloperonospora arabidopsidis (strain Emoy2) TaxID=559515 RepID=M4BDI0_HYAAE